MKDFKQLKLSSREEAQKYVLNFRKVCPTHISMQDTIIVRKVSFGRATCFKKGRLVVGVGCPNSQYKRHLQNCIPSCLPLLKDV